MLVENEGLRKGKVDLQYLHVIIKYLRGLYTSFFNLLYIDEAF